jgi:hypothetical protein
MNELSLVTRLGIDWELILDSAVGLDRRSPDEPKRSSDLEKKIGKLFAVTKREFGKRSIWLRKLTITLLILMILPVAAHAVGLVLIVRDHVIAGTALSTIGLVGLFGVVWQLWAFGRDQVKLEMMPYGYELLFALCKTDDQYHSVLTAFLNEVTVLKSGLAPSMTDLHN